jgi:hypothetical protein
MEWTKVESTQIDEVGYEPETQTLGIRFLPSKTQQATGITRVDDYYVYANVTPRTHLALMGAESFGKYFGQNIKSLPNLYPYTKVEEDHTQPTGKATTESSGDTQPLDPPSPGSALALIDGMDDDLLFTPGRVTDEQLAIMRSDWLSEAKKYDISTESKRTELKRFARPLQKLRTGIEARAKELTGATKRKIAAIDAEKRRLVLVVGGIENEVLAPLTAWEKEEETRKFTLARKVQFLADLGMLNSHWPESGCIEKAIAELESFDLSTMQEYKVGAESAITASLKVLKTELVRRQEAEAQRTELATLRAEAAARAEQERIAGVVEQAVEAERQRIESERVMMEQRTQEAERRAGEAASRALRDQEQAVENERMRTAVEAKWERVEGAEARAAGIAHRLKIDNEALGAIVALDIPMDRAQDLLIAISKGLVPHVSITY